MGGSAREREQLVAVGEPTHTLLAALQEQLRQWRSLGTFQRSRMFRDFGKRAGLPLFLHHLPKNRAPATAFSDSSSGAPVHRLASCMSPVCYSLTSVAADYFFIFTNCGMKLSAGINGTNWKTTSGW